MSRRRGTQHKRPRLDPDRECPPEFLLRPVIVWAVDEGEICPFCDGDVIHGQVLELITDEGAGRRASAPDGAPAA